MANIFDLFSQIESAQSASLVGAIIVGLGNPGSEYERTRHNAGYIAIDYIASRLGGRCDRVKFHSLVYDGRIGNTRVLLMKPTTYMNNSGVAVAEACAFYKIPPERVIVLCDDISLDPGVIRIRRKGSAGGHNGLKSIIAQIGSQDFPRVKIGIGKKPRPDYDLADWVLGRMSEADLVAIGERLSNIHDSVGLILDGKIEEAMSSFSN